MTVKNKPSTLRVKNKKNRTRKKPIQKAGNKNDVKKKIKRKNMRRSRSNKIKSNYSYEYSNYKFHYGIYIIRKILLKIATQKKYSLEYIDNIHYRVNESVKIANLKETETEKAAVLLNAEKLDIITPYFKTDTNEYYIIDKYYIRILDTEHIKVINYDIPIKDLIKLFNNNIYSANRSSIGITPIHHYINYNELDVDMLSRKELFKLEIEYIDSKTPSDIITLSRDKCPIK